MAINSSTAIRVFCHELTFFAETFVEEGPGEGSASGWQLGGLRALNSRLTGS